MRLNFHRYKGKRSPLPQDVSRQEAPLQPARHAGRLPRAAHLAEAADVRNDAEEAPVDRHRAAGQRSPAGRVEVAQNPVRGSCRGGCQFYPNTVLAHF